MFFFIYQCELKILFAKGKIQCRYYFSIKREKIEVYRTRWISEGNLLLLSPPLICFFRNAQWYIWVVWMMNANTVAFFCMSSESLGIFLLLLLVTTVSSIENFMRSFCQNTKKANIILTLFILTFIRSGDPGYPLAGFTKFDPGVSP